MGRHAGGYLTRLGNYFKRLRDDPTASLVISRPLLERPDETLSLGLARRRSKECFLFGSGLAQEQRIEDAGASGVKALKPNSFQE